MTGTSRSKMKTRLIKTRKTKAGQPPGTLTPISIEQNGVTMEIINYDSKKITTKKVKTLDDCLSEIKDSNTVTWVNVKGLSDGSMIKQLGEALGIHVLWLEDVLNTDHRPKLEELDDLIFCIIKAIDYDNRIAQKISFEQISLFLGSNFVISFQELSNDVFQSVMVRLEKHKGRIRSSKSDYLFYALIDSIVDDYYDSLEKIGTEIESLEKNIIENFDSQIYMEISRLRNELIYLKKSATPIRDVLHQCLSTDKEEIYEYNKKYFKDAYDHTVQVVDIIASYFEMLSSAKDAFASAQSNKMNEVMKVLTVLSTIFIPLTFISGIYGMNFETIPELKWKYGYLYFWSLVFLMGVGLYFYFKNKKWL